MATLYFGGSFNPIHHGHLLCSRAVAESRGYDRVILVPSATPPHKLNCATLAGSEERVAMARGAIGPDALFDVSTIEIKRTGPSYTLDTARQLAAETGGPVHWLIGADMLLYLPQWHLVDDLLREVTFIVMQRPGWTMDWDTLAPKYRFLQQNLVEAPLISLSATEIRARVSAGKSIRFFTPDAVCDYISGHGLYRNP